jgi:hypothetical protein
LEKRKMAAKIELTNEQYSSLIKLVYLGSWMATSIYEDHDEELDALENHLYSFYKNFDMDEWIEFSAKMGNFFPTPEFEESMGEYVDNYDDFVFWKQLAERLSRRDLEKELGVEKVEAMDYIELTSLMEPLMEKYTNEFVDNGIEKVFLQNSLKVL